VTLRKLIREVVPEQVYKMYLTFSASYLAVSSLSKKFYQPLMYVIDVQHQFNPLHIYYFRLSIYQFFPMSP